MLWEGVNVGCQSVLLSSCIALSFHTTRKNYSTLIHSSDRELILYIYIYIDIYFKNLFYHSSLLYQSMLVGGGGCTPLGGDWFYIHLYIHTFLSRTSSIILHVSPIPHFWKTPFNHSFLCNGLSSLYFSIVSSTILHCSTSPCFWEGVDVDVKVFFYHPALLHCSVIPYH